MSFFTGHANKYHPRFHRHVNADIEEDHRIEDHRCFPKLHVMFANEPVSEIKVHEQRIGGDGRVVITHTVETVYETGGVDSAAEEYIKRKHHDLELQKLQSMREA
ncbi:hypothetical protein QJS04_geneDACA004307 [Acorus gramineus]|uniref:Uncharacterized protein n=1 Tax=Acorus gramineus TaxID=55184 RepID=A0AAV9B2H9_ACOGR|nr:hypothetical protein QJS04_geneDACA004307 [Acorus gramineus]